MHMSDKIILESYLSNETNYILEVTRKKKQGYYNGNAEGYEYPTLQVGMK